MSKKYKLTAKEVVHAYENPQWFKDTFKECFETELEVNKWYKWKNKDLLFCVREIQGDEIYYFGFEHDGYTDNDWINKDNDFEPATEKEVEEALVKNAINKYKSTDDIICLNSKKVYKFDEDYITEFKNNILWYKGLCVFDNGKWADVKIYTISEAEEKFGIKIDTGWTTIIV